MSKPFWIDIISQESIPQLEASTFLRYLRSHADQASLSMLGILYTAQNMKTMADLFAGWLSPQTPKHLPLLVFTTHPEPELWMSQHKKGVDYLVLDLLTQRESGAINIIVSSVVSKASS